MFSAGMGTDIQELKHSGKSGFPGHLRRPDPLGPWAPCWPLSSTGGLPHPGSPSLQNIFICVILCHLGFHLLVETLKELGTALHQGGQHHPCRRPHRRCVGPHLLTVVTSLGGECEHRPGAGEDCPLLRLCGGGGLPSSNSLTGTPPKGATRTCAAGRWRPLCCAADELPRRGVLRCGGYHRRLLRGLIITLTPKAKYVESKFAPLSYLLPHPIFCQISV